MQQTKRRLKRNLGLCKQNIIFIFISQLFTETVAFILAVPYILWRIFFPLDSRQGHPISKLFRKIFEFKKTKHIVGINLAIFLVFAALIQSSLIARNSIQTNPAILPLKSTTKSTKTELALRNPVPGYISQHFSWYHPGIDIAGNNNAIIHPIANGKVIRVESSLFGYGLHVYIDHKNGFISHYAHLQDIDVTPGEIVTKRSVIGHVGSTGHSTGPHLHLEIYQDDTAINPLALIPDGYIDSFVSLSTPAATPYIASGNVLPKDVAEKLATFSAKISYQESK